MNSGPVRGFVDGSQSMSSGSRSLMCWSREAAGAERSAVSQVRTASVRSNTTTDGAARPFSRFVRLRGATRGVAGAVQQENVPPMTATGAAHRPG